MTSNTDCKRLTFFTIDFGNGFLAGTIFTACLFFLFSPAHAEQQSPEVRALTMRVGAEINSSIECSKQAFALQDKLTAAEAEVKRLSEKYEAKAKDTAPEDVNTDLGRKTVKPADAKPELKDSPNIPSRP